MKLQDADFFYINLSRRPDRREHAEAEFAKVGIDAQRFEAFTPDQWRGTPEQVARMQAGVPGGTPGAIGCFHSQTEVIRTVVDTDRVVCVCEDDVVFCEDLKTRLAYLDEHLMWDWDIIWGGATFHVPGVWCHHEDCKDWGPSIGRDVVPTNDPHILRAYATWSTYCYFVNGIHARKVLDLFDANIHRARGIDHLCIILGDQLNAYSFVPGCSWQMDGQSNIGDGVTDFSGFKKLGAYSWTDYMGDFDPTTFNWDPQ